MEVPEPRTVIFNGAGGILNSAESFAKAGPSYEFNTC
jgi:hypothetical protein